MFTFDVTMTSPPAPAAPPLPAGNAPQASPPDPPSPPRLVAQMPGPSSSTDTMAPLLGPLVVVLTLTILGAAVSPGSPSSAASPSVQQPKKQISMPQPSSPLSPYLPSLRCATRFWLPPRLRPGVGMSRSSWPASPNNPAGK